MAEHQTECGALLSSGSWMTAQVAHSKLRAKLSLGKISELGVVLPLSKHQAGHCTSLSFSLLICEMGSLAKLTLDSLSWLL